MVAASPWIASPAHSSKAESFEEHYQRERRIRLIPSLRLASVVCLALNLICFFLPLGSQPLKRILTSTFAVGLVSIFAYMRCSRTSCRFYDFLAFSWLTGKVVSNMLTNAQTEKLLFGNDQHGIVAGERDEVLVLFTQLSYYAVACVCAEPNFKFTMVSLHVSMCAWIASCLGIGMSISFETWVMITAIFYFTCLALVVQCRSFELHRRHLLKAHIALEERAEIDRELVKVERDASLARVAVAEQSALLSFVRSVFDTFGYLELGASQDTDELRLCFSQDVNPSLDHLLQQSTAGKPLDALLGPMPPVPGEQKDKWLEERARLWAYAALETAGCDESSREAPARKLALSCRDANGSPLEIELFVQSVLAGRAIFGILGPNAERVKMSPECLLPLDRPDVARHQRPPSVASASAASGTRISSVSSGLMPLDSFDPDVVSCLVDLQKPGLPILICSMGFVTMLEGPCPIGTRLLDRLKPQQGKELNLWMCQRVYALFGQSAGDAAPLPPRVFPLALFGFKGEGARHEICADVAITLPHCDAGEEEDQVPISLTFTNLRKRRVARRQRTKGTPTNT